MKRHAFPLPSPRSLRALLGLPLSALIGILAAALLLAAGHVGERAAHAHPLPGGTPKLILSTMTVTPTLTAPGSAPLTYSIHLVNTGAWTATATSLTDALPAAVSYEPASLQYSAGSGQVQNGIVTWTGDVGFDSAVAITFSAQLSSTFAGGAVVNTAVVSHAQIAQPLVLSATTQVTDQPVLRISKTSAPELPGPNKPLVYTLTVTNVGQAANNLPLVVSDVVPANTTFLSAEPDGSLGGGSVTWSRPITLGVGESTVFTFSVTIGDVPSGTVIANTDYGIAAPANVITAGPAYTVTVVKPAFFLYKQAEPDPPGSNREMTYTLTVVNNGSRATHVVVTDVVPGGVTYVRGGTQAGGSVSWSLPDLETGASANVTYTVAVPDVAGVLIANTDYRVCSAEGVCQTGLPLVSSVNGPNFRVSARVDPLAKKPGGGSGPGTTVTPTLVLRNLGPGSAINAQAVIYFTRISVSSNDLIAVPALGTLPPFPPGPLCGDNCVSYVWVGSLAAGQAVTFTTTTGQSTIGGEEGTVYTATLAVSDTLSNGSTEPITGTATGKVTHFANVIPTKSAPPVIGRGQLLTYTLDIVNGGLTVEFPPVLSDTVPLSTTFVAASSGGATQTVAGRTVVSWTLPLLGPGESTQRTFTVRVAGDLISGTQILNNRYGVSWTESETSTLFANPGVPVTTTVKDAGLIDSFKVVTPTWALPGAGQVLTYVLHIVNSSAVPLSGVTVDDTLPWESSTYQRDATASAGTVISDIVSVHWTGSVAAFASEALTLSVRVDPDYNGPITNTAVISHPSLLSPVIAQAVAYLTTQPVLFISKSATPDPVPLGEELVYSLRVVNAGQLATGLVVTDVLPANTQYVAGSASADGQLQGGQLRWEFPVLQPGEARTLTYRAAVTNGQEVINERYRVSSAEGVSAVGTPVVTAITGGGRIYLPLIRR